ncbi:hypothetical protein HPB47_004684, partial [Ixodes persulcatus]
MDCGRRVASPYHQTLDLTCSECPTKPRALNTKSSFSSRNIERMMYGSGVKVPQPTSGDVRKFAVVDVPGLHHLKDCIGFPAKGPMRHPNEMADLIRSIKARFTLYEEDKEACLAMFLNPRFKYTIFKTEKDKLLWLKAL